MPQTSKRHSDTKSPTERYLFELQTRDRDISFFNSDMSNFNADISIYDGCSENK